MGKSPGKWIKKMLFGKKSSKPQVLKRNAIDKGQKDGRTSSGLASPVISQPMAVNDSGNGILLESEIATHPSLPGGQLESSPVSDHARNQASSYPEDANDPQRIKLERAAVKAQAVFRGYLARRAFRALWGIIRLQAVIRGHLVRRQAVATIQCILGIVKLQAVVRGRKVRLCSEVDAKHYQVASEVAKHLNSSTIGISSLKMKFRDHTFISKLLSGTPVTMPLQIHYVDGEPNSAWSWLERWTHSSIWKPLHKPKKVGSLKSQGKHGPSIQSESGRSKRSVRRNFSSNTEHGNMNAIADCEKSKRNTRKYTPSEVVVTQENSQSELEKVKRSLRKITSSPTVQVDEDAADKSKLGAKKVSNHPNVEKREREPAAIPLVVEVKPSLGSGSILEQDTVPTADDQTLKVNNSIDDHNVVNDSFPLQGIVLEENRSLLNEDLIPKEDQFHDNEKTTRRRASFSSKCDYPENNVQDTPKLPSYMAATESAKAKLRGQISPRFSADAVDKNIARRHSLPSSTNGKLTSQSPRVQRIVPTSGGRGIKSDRSLPSSRDDKLIQVEWRR